MANDNQAKAPVVKLGNARFRPAESMRNVWRINVDPAIGEVDLKKEIFWSHVAHMMRAFDKIEVRADDDSFFGELIVLSVGKQWARVHVLGWINFGEATQRAPEGMEGDDYKAEYKGAQNKWCVIRLKDKEVIKEKLDDKLSAMKWIENHVKAMK